MKTNLVQRIVTLLETDGHYVPKPSQLVIEDVAFPYDAALLGPKDEQGEVREHLVLVQAVEPQETRAIYDRIQALTMILARTGSQRPLTLILVVPKPTDPAFSDFSELCRVILVPSEESGDVTASLKELLPLELPQAEHVALSPETRLKRRLGKRADDPLVSALLHAARSSDEAVTKSMRERLAQAVTQETGTVPE